MKTLLLLALSLAFVGLSVIGIALQALLFLSLFSELSLMLPNFVLLLISELVEVVSE